MATIHSGAVSWKLSGSNWNTKHLEALRVLFDTAKSDPLPPFLTQNYRDQAKEIIFKTEFSGKTEFQSWPSAYVETHAHKELRQEGALFGAFFVAMADVLSRKRENSESKTLASTRSPRIHRAPNRPDMTTGEGFSSPPRSSAGSSQGIQIPSSNSSYHPGNDDHHEPLPIEEQRERRKDETVARMMASQFISAVIDLFTDQHSNDTRIEFSDEPTNFILKSPRFNCTCQDDGSIIRKMKLPETGKWVYDSFKCSLEVKSAFDLEDPSSGKGLVKESVLAQQACELMGSMMLVVDILQEEAKEDASEELDDLPESRDEDQGALLTSLKSRDTL